MEVTESFTYCADAAHKQVIDLLTLANTPGTSFYGRAKPQLTEYKLFNVAVNNNLNIAGIVSWSLVLSSTQGNT